MSQTHALAYWTEADRGTDDDNRALEAAVRKFEEGLDKLFFGWLVDYRAYVMHRRLVFRCEVRARKRTAAVEESVPTKILLRAEREPDPFLRSGYVAQAELQLQHLPLACMLRLASMKTEDCQA